MPANQYRRYEGVQWFFWQMSGLGPMSGQAFYFTAHAPERTAYAIERYLNETHRLYGVLNKRLADREFIVGEYSIADIACYPWIIAYEKLGLSIDEFPHLKRWIKAINKRPAVIRAYDRGNEFSSDIVMSDEAKKIMYGQTAARLGLVDSGR